VRFTGAVPDPVLAAYYRTADVFVCASEHEGFCVPVVEAMQFGLPVVAFAATAVVETAAEAALLIDDKSPLALAAAVHRVLSDPSLATVLTDAGSARAEVFSLEHSRTRWVAAIDEALAVAEAGAA
jgi:L-malate glycosyltransferase